MRNVSYKNVWHTSELIMHVESPLILLIKIKNNMKAENNV